MVKLRPFWFRPHFSLFFCWNKSQPDGALDEILSPEEIDQKEMYMRATCRRSLCRLPSLEATNVVDEEE
jgi:hypothetical protein